MLRLENVSKRWEYRAILKNLTFHIREGECAAILGANGAGKSTLIKLISTLVSPTEGSIYLQGKLLKDTDPVVRKQIGYLFHQSSFYQHLTAVDNLKIICRWYQVEDAKASIARVLEQVGLRLAKDEKIQNFSRGMVQRLAIARVLLIKARLLLLDEPHTGLDQDGVRWFNALIKEQMAEGVTILLVSHDLGQVEELADQVLWLDQGRLVKELKRADVSEIDFQRQVWNR